MKHLKLTGNTLIFIIGAALLVAFAGCNTESNRPSADDLDTAQGRPMAMIIKQQTDTLSANTSSQLLHSFRYAKIPVQTYDTELPGANFSIPSSVQLICLTLPDVSSLSDDIIESLVNFVAAGNMLLVTNPVFEDRLNYLTGIKKNVAYELNTEAVGVRLNEMVFPNYRNGKFKLRVPSKHNGLASSVFKDAVDVIATSYDSLRAPIITRYRVGQGQTIMFNSQASYDKLYRGLLFSLTLPAFKGVPYAVANLSTIFLDDFPLPLYDEMSPPIDWEYNVTEEEFITNIWWPDMQALADSFSIDYTAILAFNYNANVVPPFDFQEWQTSDIPVQDVERTGSIGLAQNVAQSRHELGFHGYNHFSLWLEDWQNIEFMIASLQAARKRWQIDNLGALPETYVPPTNQIDSVGIEALTRAMPNIEYLSSLYLGVLEDGGGREFGPDPYNDDLYNYPRIASGFVIDEEGMFNIHSLYLLTGIWTHFVHPDDVFQVSQRKEDTFASRNEMGLGWKKSREFNYGLYDTFRVHLDYMEQTYPLVNYRTAAEAVPKVKQWNQLQLQRGVASGKNYVAKQNNRGRETSWFVYVDETHVDSLANILGNYSGQIHQTPIWNGYLMQFNTLQDSLALPDFSPSVDISSIRESVRSQYQDYITDKPTTDSSAGGSQQSWRDTRLEDAMARLKANPDSRQIQEKVIDLAVEFERVPVAIDILEKRLINDANWQSDDINRLLTYYGWEGASARAFNFLEELWQRHGSQSVITLKEMMVQQYGVPDEEFTDKWLMRELALNPKNENVLQRLVLNNQTEESWPQTKEYLDRLIELNPASDSLYAYKLQRSFYYDEPQQTLSMLENFPHEANNQLRPLARQIAEAYGYSAGNYSKALQWANRAEDFPVQPRLEWLLQEKRFRAFIEQGDEALNRQPANDSLRTYIGQQLIYNGFYEQGYERLYPLFEKQESPPASAANLVHTEIGYQTYRQKKAFYRQYPAFFSDSLEQTLQHQYRMEEGFKGGLTADYTSDNFNNTTAHWGPFVEWGNRQKYIHRAAVEQKLVSSDESLDELSSSLLHLYYQYQHLWPEDGLQLTAGAGVYYNDKGTRPDALLSIGYGRDSTYTSAQLTYRPEFTNTALQREINELNLSTYHEQYFIGNNLQTTLSLSGKYYSNDVTAYEALGRLYARAPFSTSLNRFRAIGELSFSDATEDFENADPFFTPNKLFIQGIGVEYRHRDVLQNPDLSIQLEVLGKHNSKDGYYLTSGVDLSARLQKYWQISLNADISSSAIYRYNRIGLTVSYLFPKQLK